MRLKGKCLLCSSLVSLFLISDTWSISMWCMLSMVVKCKGNGTLLTSSNFQVTSIKILESSYWILPGDACAGRFSLQGWIFWPSVWNSRHEGRLTFLYMDRFQLNFFLLKARTKIEGHVTKYSSLLPLLSTYFLLISVLESASSTSF